MHSCDFDIQVVSTTVIELDIFSAESLRITAKINSHRVISSTNTNDGRPHKHHQKPTKETQQVNALLR